MYHIDLVEFFLFAGSVQQQLSLQLVKKKKNDGPTSDWCINRAPGQSHVLLWEGKPSIKINCHLFAFFSVVIGAFYLLLLSMLRAKF